MTGSNEEGDQLALIAAPKAKKKQRSPQAHEPASVDPVAEVVLDVSLPHLDHTFDYMVPAKMAEDAQPGVRISARFGARDVDGFIVARKAETSFGGKLAPLRRVVSPEKVLTPDVLTLAREVATHYSGTLADVLRLAIPPRHARVEKEEADHLEESETREENFEAGESEWAQYLGGPALLRRLSEGNNPRAVWQALPNSRITDASATWPDALAQAAKATQHSGKGSLLIAPNARDVERLIAACENAGLHPVRLTADEGPSVRYRAFLQVLRGQRHIVVGTRAAIFAPISHLGLVALWDDGDDSLIEQRAPYPHPRTVLRMRAQHGAAAAIIGGYTRTVEAQQWLDEQWARAVVAPRDVVRERTARVRTLRTTDQMGSGAAAPARIPQQVISLGRKALRSGPMLVQVPRAGYVPRVACATCREPARCSQCHGPLELDDATSVPRCGWCARVGGWQCPECQGTRLRSVVVGSSRTAEELGRAFPSVPITLSGGRAPSVVDEVDDAKRIVVATPGAEPIAAGGYAAAVILDAGMASAHSDLRAGEEALRRWLTAGALVRGGMNGEIVVVGDGPPVATEALVRWDPVGFAQRELAERQELSLPPAVNTATLTGEHAVVTAALQRLTVPDGYEVLGPVPINDDQTRAIIRGSAQHDWEESHAGREALARALTTLQANRTARKMSGTLRVQLDPHELI